MEALGGGTAETLPESLRTSDATMRAAQLRVLGGAVARVADDATAFAHRRSRILVNIAASYEGPASRAAREAWVARAAERDQARRVDLGDRGIVRTGRTPEERIQA